MIRRGCIHWARLDKRRPVLVLSPNYRNEWATDVLAVPCSTVRKIAPTHVLLKRGEGGLPSPFAAKCEQVATLLRADLEPEALGSPISRERLDAVERALLGALGIDPLALERHLSAMLEMDL